MNGESTSKFRTDVVRLLDAARTLFEKPAQPEKVSSSFNPPVPHEYVYAEERIGPILEKNLIKWLRLLQENSVYKSTEIASSFASEVLGDQSVTLSLEEIVIFYTKLKYFLDGQEEAEEIYRSLIFRDVIRFSIGSIDGKTLELWLKKNSGARGATETAIIADSFIDEVLSSERSVLSIPEMEVLFSRMRVAFGSGMAEKVYVELRFRQMLFFTSEV